MKILWMCNVIIPKISQKLNRPQNNFGGWIVGLLEVLKNDQDIELAICFPIDNENEILQGHIDGLKYYAFNRNQVNQIYYDDTVEHNLKKIINDFEPDLVHIFGTEFPHTLAMTKIFNKPERTIVNIQGLCSVIEKHFLDGLPWKVQKKYTFKDFIKRENLIKQRNNFKIRGEYEIKALHNVSNVIGRTTWDRACTSQINPIVNYYHCNETLRDSFYNKSWNLEKCEKYSIFISQCSYPIKGFHYMLEAFPYVLKKYPNAHIYTTGHDFVNNSTFKDNIRISSYHQYLKQTIIKNNLKDKITFLGDLNEEQMCSRYLNSHVFVSPSTIENSPNSVGEAMILGVPTIASDVGGVKDMLVNNEEGFIYPKDEYYMLAYYICEIFSNDKLANDVSKKAKQHALETHNRKKNTLKMKHIYNDIMHKQDVKYDEIRR